MKKLFLTLICVNLFALADAQIAKWLIEPYHDKIKMAEGIDAVITDSADTQILWSMTGEKLVKTHNKFLDFRDNRSVSLIPGTVNIEGIIKDNGTFIALDKCYTTHAYPYYSCGKLLIQTDRYLRFVDLNGKLCEGKYCSAYPFFNGYASCETFSNLEKNKNPYFLMVNTNEESVRFSYDDKEINPDDIEFISSVNDEKIAFLVIKHKVYLFDASKGSGVLEPVYAPNVEINPKNQAKLDGDFSKCIEMLASESFVLNAKCGKNTVVKFEFDRMRRPVSFTVNDIVKKYNVTIEKTKDLSTPLKVYEESNLYNICWGEKEILPAQFDQPAICFGNKAFVVKNGKYGMLGIDKDTNFSIKINKGNDIAFLHQKFETTIRVDMPTYIRADKTYLEINPNSGIELDKTSRESKNTESGNFVQYNCILTIPKDLPDEIKEIEYPIQILYNGLVSPVINHKVNAWFYKKYEIEEDESQRSVEQGNLTFVFNVTNAQQDNSIVKFDVTVTADTLAVQRENKMSETRYKYKVSNLKEGINNIVVNVLEQGCPPASFPFEVEYHRPIPKTKSTPASTEKVVIKRKKQDQKSTPVPDLHI